MVDAAMIISMGRLRPDTLRDQVALVTGGGGGIGREAVRALLWLGAKVCIAEVDATAAETTAAYLTAEWGVGRVLAMPTDVSDERQVARLVEAVHDTFGVLDIVLNNATVAPVGEAVWETPIGDWDRSYAVNLRAPALLARGALPAMIERGHGVFACVSSVGGPFQAAYESVKAAQVELANALDAELSGSGIHAFTIGPGLVPTATAVAAIPRLLPRLGLSGEEFLSLTQSTVLSVEAAGAGFAAAIAMAERYAGQEVSSTQALIDAGIELPPDPAAFPIDGLANAAGPAATKAAVQLADANALLPLVRRVRSTLGEQADGWRRRSFFERQWMLRDFKQRAGMPVERWVEWLDRLEQQLASGATLDHVRERDALGRLAAFYGHLGDLARGYVKDPAQRDEQLQVVGGWRSEVDQLIVGLG